MPPGMGRMNAELPEVGSSLTCLMHAGRFAALTPTTGNPLPPTAFGAVAATHVILTRIYDTFWLPACRSNRLQHLVPAAPAVEQAEGDECHHLTHDGAAGVAITTSSELESQLYQAADRPVIDLVPQQLEDVQQHVDDSNQFLHAPQHLASEPQQLQQLRIWPQLTSSDDWTVSQDDDILSAMATLPRDEFPGNGTFVGGRFTFSDLRSDGKAAHVAAGLQEHSTANGKLTNQADASGVTKPALLEAEPQPQQAVSCNPAALDNSTTSCISSDSNDASEGLQDSRNLLEGVHDSSNLMEGVQNSSNHQQGLQDSSNHNLTAAAAAGSAAAAQRGSAAATLLEGPTGSYFSSRSTMLQQLHQQQLQIQRDHLLNKQRKNLYNYTISDSGRVIKRSKPGPKSPLAQSTFALARKQPVQSSVATAADDVGATGDSSNTAGQVERSSVSTDRPAQQQLLLQRRHRLQQMLPLDEAEVEQSPGPKSSALRSANQSNSGSRTQSSSRGSNTLPTAPAAGDLSRGLCLSVFLYCCSQSKLLNLTWQLGLPPNAMSFVSRVADADVVLHVKPQAGEKHFHYDEYRQQAAKKGIPMVDLKNLSVQEVQLYLLPVFKLYAGEVSPRDLLRRQKARGWKKRYTNIKLPPA